MPEGFADLTSKRVAQDNFSSAAPFSQGLTLNDSVVIGKGMILHLPKNPDYPHQSIIEAGKLI
jgi:hypothetical protein